MDAPSGSKQHWTCATHNHGKHSPMALEVWWLPFESSVLATGMAKAGGELGPG